MKKRIVSAVMAAAMATSPVFAIPVTTAQAQTEPPMRDRYHITVDQPPAPFGVDGTTSVFLPFSEMPEGTDIRIRVSNHLGGWQEGGVVVGPEPGGLRVSIHPEQFGDYREKITNWQTYTVKFPDESWYVTRFDVTVHPALRYRYTPKLDTTEVTQGEEKTLKFVDLPQDTKVEVVEAPEGWSVDTTGEGLKVKAGSEGAADVKVNLTYSDTSSEPHTFTITSVAGAAPTTTSPEPTAPEQPRTPSGFTSFLNFLSEMIKAIRGIIRIS